MDPNGQELQLNYRHGSQGFVNAPLPSYTPTHDPLNLIFSRLSGLSAFHHKTKGGHSRVGARAKNIKSIDQVQGLIEERRKMFDLNGRAKSDHTNRSPNGRINTVDGASVDSADLIGAETV